MKRFANLLFVVFACTSFSSFGQIINPPPSDEQTVPPKPDTTYWTGSFKFGMNLTQAAFSQNWKAGGVNSIAFNSLLQTKTDYVRERATFHAEADLQYGSVKNQDVEWRKTTDKIFLDAKYGYSFHKAWSFYASLNFLSQFYKGYKYNGFKDRSGAEFTRGRLLISDIFAPAYFTQSVGVEYKPTDYFFLRLGTGTLRQTIVRRDIPPVGFQTPDDTLYMQETKNYGVPIGKNLRNEFALQILASFDRDVAKNLNLKARYIAFLNYKKFATPRDWDHRFEATILAKVNKYVNTSLSGIMIYDRDADNKVQFSQTLALGVLISIGDTK